jgi:hypothetical protein
MIIYIYIYIYHERQTFLSVVFFYELSVAYIILIKAVLFDSTRISGWGTLPFNNVIQPCKILLEERMHRLPQF